MSGTEEEVDYMSDAFLTESVGNNDVKPGLSFTHASKRKLELHKKKLVEVEERKKKRLCPAKNLQAERLHEGMNTAISSSNIGFALMQKMGYKPGTSLGKEGQGLLEPVGVEVKADRVGLGWQQMLADKKKRLEMMRQQRQQRQEMMMDPLEYRARLSSQRRQKQVEGDLRKCQRMCYELDSREGMLEPAEQWFWPSYAKETEEEEEEEEEEEYDYEEETLMPEEQLEVLVEYLKSSYYYCIWCGTTYGDDDDLQKHCPGPAREDHGD